MAGCEPPALTGPPLLLGLDLPVREHLPRLPLVVDFIHECDASWKVEQLRKLADHWDTEAAVTDTHGAYMRSMAYELREILDGVALASGTGSGEGPGRGPGSRAAGVPGRASADHAHPSPPAKAKGRAGKNKPAARR